MAKNINKLIDLSITLDIFCSMVGNKFIMAKRALIQLIQKLNDEDNITISKFYKKSTHAFKEAYNSMTMENCDKNKIRRMIIITDMEDSFNKFLTEFCEKISEEGIYISILVISNSFRTNLAELTSHVKGANYVVIKEMKDINNYLVEDSEYLCFPKCSKYKIRIYYSKCIIERIADSGKEGVEEIIDKTGWNLEKYKYYSDDFKEKIDVIDLKNFFIDYPDKNKHKSILL